MLDCLLTSLTEIEVPALTTCIPYTHYRLDAAAIALKLWCRLLNDASRLLLNKLSENIVYLTSQLLVYQVLDSFQWYFTVLFLALVNFWLFGLAVLFVSDLSFCKLHKKSNALLL